MNFYVHDILMDGISNLYPNNFNHFCKRLDDDFEDFIFKRKIIPEESLPKFRGASVKVDEKDFFEGRSFTFLISLISISPLGYICLDNGKHSGPYKYVTRQYKEKRKIIPGHNSI